MMHPYTFSPVAPTGGYRLPGTINGVEVALLVDTGAAVTLLCRDVLAMYHDPVATRPGTMVSSHTGECRWYTPSLFMVVRQWD